MPKALHPNNPALIVWGPHKQTAGWGKRKTMSIKDNLIKVRNTVPQGVTLVAVSKTKPVEDLQAAYDAGQRVFGENHALEMRDKHEALPKDIQ